VEQAVLLHDSVYLPKLLEVDREHEKALRLRLMAVHQADCKKLTKRQHHYRALLLKEDAEFLLTHAEGEEDAEVKAIYDSFSAMSWDEASEAHQSHEFGFIAGMIHSQFGVEVDPSRMSDENYTAEIAAELHQKAHNQARQETEQPVKKRKLSKKQQEAQAKKEAVVADLSKTTRQIYLDLVKNLHPDRELDEALRAEKTKQMQEVTDAYEKGDYLRLLELQMTLLEERDNALETLGAAQLGLLTETLRQQAAELDQRGYYLEQPYSIWFNPGSVYDRSESRMKRQTKAYIEDRRDEITEIQGDLALLSTRGGLAKFLTLWR
jgi:hypothetical protein